MSDAKESQPRFLQVLFAFEVCLIAATWPLWFGEAQFPQVPLFSWAVNIPGWIDQVFTSLMLLFCVAGIWTSRRRFQSTDIQDHSVFVCVAGSAVCGTVLAILNQHRLQPWHWLFLLLQLQRLATTACERKRLHRLTFASIYIFAATSRIGPQIATGMSPQVLHSLLTLSGLTKLAANQTFVENGCWLMSIAEAAIGVALLWPRLRRPAAIAAIATHALLLLALSPLGLSHHFGVLLWNLFLLLAIPMLFWRQNKTEMRSSVSGRCRMLAVFLIGFPLSSLFGLGDNWPGWQLYSPRTDVVQLYVRTTAVDSLPSSCQAFVSAPLPLQEFCPVRIDRWSLQQTKSPLYPEDRFQLAVVRELVRELAPVDVQITLKTASVPMWWKQEQIQLDAITAPQLQRQFLLNSAVRNSSFEN